MPKVVAIAQAELKRILHYDADTGVWTWRAAPKRHLNGRRADHQRDNRRPYRVVIIRCKKYYAHRLAWLYSYGEWPASDLDHIDQDKSNNSLANLRLATDSLNNANKPTIPRALPRGVDIATKNKRNPFQARIKVNHRSIHLGNFPTAAEAAIAYKTAATRYFGQFAVTE